MSQLESTIATLQSNLDYYKNVYGNSCDIDDFDESEKVAKSAREAIRLFKGWIKVLEDFNADVQKHRELVVREDDVEQSNSENSKENLTAKLEELSIQLEEVTAQRDKLEYQLNMAQQTINGLQSTNEENPVVQNSPNTDTQTTTSTTNLVDNNILHVFCKDSKGKYSASGKYNIETKCLTVLQGSHISPNVYLTRNQGEYYRYSAEYVNNDYILQKDIIFDTVSDAGVFVMGNSVRGSGMEVWKDSSGMTLKKILSKTPMAIRTEYDTTKLIEEPILETVIEPTETTASQNNISFKILEQYFNVDSYMEVYYKVLEMLLIKYPYVIAILGSKLNLNVEGVSLFSYNEHDAHFNGIPIKRRLANNLWVGIVDDKDTILDNIDKILGYCKCPKDKFKIL